MKQLALVQTNIQPSYFIFILNTKKLQASRQKQWKIVIELSVQSRQIQKDIKSNN